MRTINATEKEKEMDLYEGRLWKNWADFAKEHDMILANWVESMFYDEWYPDFYNYDPDEYEEIYQYFITDYSTIQDIDYFNIDMAYCVINTKDNDEIYVICVQHFGTPWEGVGLYYYDEENEEEDDDDEDEKPEEEDWL